MTMQIASISLGFTAAAIVAALTPALPAQATTPTCHGVRATIVGTAGDDVIHGTPHRDVIAAGHGDDTIYGRGGNDLVCGGPGADHLYGGPGRDALYGGVDKYYSYTSYEDTVQAREGDTLHGGPGNDHMHAGVDDRRYADEVFPDVYSWSRSATGVHIDLRTGTAYGQGHDVFGRKPYKIVGSAHGDVVEGTDQADDIETGPGPDVVRARGGDDRIELDDAGVRGAEGDNDRATGGGGGDWIASRKGDDHISGGAGIDHISAFGDGNTVVNAGPDQDVLDVEIGTGAARQRFSGGQGDDQLYLRSNLLNPGAGASTGTWDMATGVMTFTFDHDISISAPYIDHAILYTQGTSWSVTGTQDADWVDARFSGSTSFNGLDGDDTFLGGAGDDMFDGGPGQDQAGMGDGDDTCISVEQLWRPDCEHVS
jgi:Ca2+-binding RTX toxin-like protein